MKFVVVLEEEDAVALVWACLAGTEFLQHQTQPIHGKAKTLDALSRVAKVITMAMPKKEGEP